MNKCACLMLLVVCCVVGVWGETQDVQNAIVKIYTVHSYPNYFAPWSADENYSSTGSGAVISGRRILTNAHVVHDPVMVQVRRNGNSRRYQARVLFVSHAADLALLAVDDPAFFDGIVPLELGSLPKKQTAVSVYGFPVGGDMLSITEGIVSRVEHQEYSHSRLSLLAIQIDAAINPGNSGGPAVSERKVVGVAMQGLNGAENVGYIIPSPVIQHFLKDVEDGSYQGIPSLGLSFQSMDNPDMRRYYGMTNDQSGVLVLSVAKGGASDGILREGDVLLSVAGHLIANDGTVEFRHNERTYFKYYLESLQLGQSLEIRILRDRKPMEMDVRLSQTWDKGRLVPPPQYDEEPSYYVYGGLVFMPFSENLMMSVGEEGIILTIPFYPYLGRLVDEDTPDEIVVLQRVLAADINEGYHDELFQEVKTVDGQPVRNLKHLVELIESGKDAEFVEFGCAAGKKIVLNRKRVAESDAFILATYQVPKACSDDLSVLPFASGDQKDTVKN